ncbi:tRNA modification GTPase mnmE [Caldalkalibacillus thermarum TA2.A1]|uniref:tRNA modification GTPase MnmE n=1 Tax=Caldalkalibacillus thermarum (strain TA2.A1) TaxID=986075 RepID=F5L4S6_CALTT|nr:tRNA uridine-5-carboxymethylaminomethyl(34) synthesis GTPase MnmE [Caldalkalibacillus thermarum]EGL83643.1 tRNA modification GTPase mnmE [Caldalkalibacillus thermarum TA2.A1]QZT34291.1 tRNA uridine-5-carboxymethylaminomethyl(34) synthesis GTPase MnmE [Caldalkalibacillus thermarum TA2.A1]
MEFDTIAAIATPMGEGGIAIVRVSGPEAIAVVDKLYRGRKKLSTVDSHTIHYGHLVDPQTGERIEEVLVTVMRAPRTYTREDVVEVNCHGGLVSVRRVLNYILKYGARLAEPGEFTKRAFLNGRIDLSQAEAVIDLIRAKTDRAMKNAMKQVEGRLSKLIKRLRQELIETLAHIEVTIDYPEHDVEEVTQQFLREKCEQVKKEIEHLLATAEQGKILREGLKTAIIGRPNVGKSSLLNALAHENRAIVTDIPGTTRDVLEEYVNVRGVPLQLIDTAGIRETEDVVERIGVERSRQVLKEADLILLVLNIAEPFTEEDQALLDLVKDMKTILIVNKTDLEPKLDTDQLKERYPHLPLIKMSIKEEKGLDELEQAIADLYFKGDIEAGDMTYVSNSRHIALLNEAKQSIEDALAALEMGLPVDVVQIDIRKAWEKLGEIIGDNVSESLIDQLFSQFCLGK